MRRSLMLVIASVAAAAGLSDSRRVIRPAVSTGLWDDSCSLWWLYYDDSSSHSIR